MKKKTKTPATPTAIFLSPEEIARRAYFRFLARGGAHGNDLEDWLEAERSLLRERLAADTPAIPPAQGRPASRS